jgi:putative heme-binding domain-containing protein
MLAEIIRSDSVSAGEIPRYLRAFDFQTSPARNDVLSDLAFGAFRGDAELRAAVVLEASRRIPASDIESQPGKLSTLDQVLTAVQGSAAFVELVAKFNVTRRFPELLAMAQKHTDEQLGVEAMRALIGRNQLELISSGLSQEDPRIATSTARALGAAADGRIVPLLLPIVVDTKRDLELRRQATRSIASTRNGAQELLNLAKAGKLDERLISAASFLLNSAPWGEIKAEAARLFPVPAAKDRALPAIDELIKAKGDSQRGGQLFAKTAECAKCHLVDGQGKDVGPNLSEIGSKLSRQALFESILYPSAGISHSYETYAVESKDGNVSMGLLVSQTDAEVTIKLADALVRTYRKDEIETIKKLETSLMPADLQKTMTAQDLIDVVEYLATLRKK